MLWPWFVDLNSIAYVWVVSAGCYANRNFNTYLFIIWSLEILFSALLWGVRPINMLSIIVWGDESIPELFLEDWLCPMNLANLFVALIAGIAATSLM